MTTLEKIEVTNAVVEELRELVRVVIIDDVIKHSNADALELAIVGGWQCCVKLGEFKKGDLAIYCEIDSMLPIGNPIFEFLQERKDGLKLVGEEVYSRIKTIRLRKELSQGLVIPVPSDMKVVAGENLTAKLGILKYEGKAESAGPSVAYDVSWYGRFCEFLAGGPLPKLQIPWPSFLKKSDQARVQNVSASYRQAVMTGEDFEVTYKLDGASMTVWACVDTEGAATTGIGSRNNELITEDVVWGPFEQFRRWLATLLMMNRRLFKIWRFILPRWKKGLIASDDQYVAMAIKLGLQERLTEFLNINRETPITGIAVQGELCGPGIQSNFEGLNEQQFFVYSVFVREGNSFKEMLPFQAAVATVMLGLKYIPIFEGSMTLPATLKECLALADGPAAFKQGGYREGLVFKSRTRNFSFKVVSNSYLLKNGD